VNLQTAKNKSWRCHLEFAQLPNKSYVLYFCFNVDLILKCNRTEEIVKSQHKLYLIYNGGVK
jgi:hypothetical protein